MTKYAAVTGNFENEFGGGVYLAGGSVLYLYADVIKENSVPVVTGYGADLYAADGSTIYYDFSVDMKREGFYICSGAVLVCMQGLEVFEDTAVDGNREIYIGVAKDSGYTDEQIEELTNKLEAAGFTVLSHKRVNIDTTDLRNWYVYDHYDPVAWDVSGNGVAAETNWNEEYGGNPRRGYYPYADSWGRIFSPPVYTIGDWLEEIERYTLQSGILYLAGFKEHIYTRNTAGSPTMTFVGYGAPPFIDFLFYDPESDGEKVVDFDVDASKVNVHTLAGNGFLINTGIKDNRLSGYLVYYSYKTNTGDTKPVQVGVYSLDKMGDADHPVSVNTFHGRIVNNGSSLSYDYLDIGSSTGITTRLGEPIAKYTIPAAEWESKMSIQIRATPSEIVIRQQPMTATANIDNIDPVLTCKLDSTGYSGFGPLVAYTTHNCYAASLFEYSNLRMYFTNPELEEKDMLSPLMYADFTQKGTQKYFLNLLGDSEKKYNESASFGQYQEYLKMMQWEGIALITDRDTPFDPYLGAGNSPDSNLHEMDYQPSVDEIANQVIEYLNGKTTTQIWDQVAIGIENTGEVIKEAEPKMTIIHN